MKNYVLSAYLYGHKKYLYLIKYNQVEGNYFMGVNKLTIVNYLRISTLCCRLKPCALLETSLVNVVAARSWA